MERHSSKISLIYITKGCSLKKNLKLQNKKSSATCKNFPEPIYCNSKRRYFSPGHDVCNGASQNLKKPFTTICQFELF